MLSAYPIVVPAWRPAISKSAELDRYVRWEYGGQMTVAALLAQSTHVSRKARTHDRRALRKAIQALKNAIRSLAKGRRSKVSTPEV